MVTEKPTIIMVDDELVSLSMFSEFLSCNYNVFTIDSGARLLKMLEWKIPDLILLDVEMPDLNGYETLKRLKAKDATKDIPIIFLTSKKDEENELLGLSLGADEYIGKSISNVILQRRVDWHIHTRRQLNDAVNIKNEAEHTKQALEAQNHELLEANANLAANAGDKAKTLTEVNDIITKLIALLMDNSDKTTSGHIGRTLEYYNIMLEGARKSGLYKNEIEAWDIANVRRSALLHDIGKMRIQDYILKKPVKLTADEFEIMKTHVQYGESTIVEMMKISSAFSFLEHARLMALTHHERWDGAGYPNGLRGREIPLQGRIMAVVDVYDALVSVRPYKKPYEHDEAVKIIAAERGRQFDPDLVDLFLEMREYFKLAKISIKDNSENDIIPN